MVNNPRIVPPDLNQYISNRKSDVKTEMNCIGIGKVLGFDSTDQTVTVQLNYIRTIYGAVPIDSSGTDQSGNKTVPYPQLVKCPLLILTGGSSYLTFPVTEGDECVILFNDRDIDTWWTTGATQNPPNSTRVHDLNDALIFVGVRSVANAIINYNMSGPQLYGSSGVCLISDLTTLRIALDALCNALLAFVDSDGDTLSPATMAAISAAKVLIDGVLI